MKRAGSGVWEGVMCRCAVEAGRLQVEEAGGLRGNAVIIRAMVMTGAASAKPELRGRQYDGAGLERRR